MDRGCVYRDCVAIEHLEPITQAENIRRQPNVRAQMAKTECPKGHKYEGHNLIKRRGRRATRRECRTCSYEWTRAAKARHQDC